jgi:hypothetical protein
MILPLMTEWSAKERNLPGKGTLLEATLPEKKSPVAEPEVSHALAMAPEVSHALAMAPEVHHALAMAPEVSHALAMAPEVHHALECLQDLHLDVAGV